MNRRASNILDVYIELQPITIHYKSQSFLVVVWQRAVSNAFGVMSLPLASSVFGMQDGSDAREKKEKTVVRTIRIPKSVESVLASDATAKNLTVNALISSILGKYVDWDRFAESYGVIGTHYELLMRLLQSVGEEEIIRIGTELGERLAKHASKFWLRDPSLESFLAILSLHGKYMEGAKWHVQWKRDECTLTYSHGLGIKWSILGQHLLGTALKMLLGTVPVCEVTERSVFLRLEVPRVLRRHSEE